jgi:hypothetical protein
METAMTTLKKTNSTAQLVVDGKPFIVLGGELGNSSASNARYMERAWPVCARLNLNTVLAPVYWELLEPAEGSFDFSLVDSMLSNARKPGLRLVLLWFGSWKNGVSCYAPEWVKKDWRRFPRCRNKKGEALDSLTPFCENNREADSRAFCALMRHVREEDGEDGTVIMIQVENETAMIDDARDRSEGAEAAYRGPVPEELIRYMAGKGDALHGGLRESWAANGAKTVGTWAELFGESPAGEEVFMAWHFARYIDSVAAAGKAIHPIPMYTNAALNRPGLAPGKYDLDGNPLFIPEAPNGPGSGARAFYAIGEHSALGYSPFAIESTPDPETSDTARAYAVLSRVAGTICELRGQGRVRGALLDTTTPCVTFPLGGYDFRVAHDHTFEWSSYHAEPVLPETGCVVACPRDGEYYVCGTGVIVSFAPPGGEGVAGIVSIDEGTFDGGVFVAGRRLNGDETHQGRLLRIEYGRYAILRARLYTFG